MMKLLGLAAALLGIAACSAPHVEDDVVAGTGQRIEKETLCPALAAPYGDFCGPGKTLKIVQDANGCDTFTCVNFCPAVAAPSAEFCGPGKTPKLVQDANGCDTFICVTSDPCDGVQCSPGSSCKQCALPGKVTAACIPDGADC